MYIFSQGMVTKSIVNFAILASAGGIFGIQNVHAQDAKAPGDDPFNRVALSATASVEVPQDWLTLTLSTARDGTEPAAVQTQLKQALDAALAVARPQAEKGQLELRSGNLSLSPRYGRDGKVNGWQGSVSLAVEGRDFARITTVAGKVQSLALQGLSFGLSPTARTALEADLQAQAIARFQAKAQAVAQSFGFKAYQLVQVTVGAVDGGGGQVRPMAMAVRAMSAVSDAPVPVEAGTSTVQLSVNGTVRLK